MAARGYRGVPHSLVQLRFRHADAWFLLAVGAYLAACRYGCPRCT